MLVDVGNEIGFIEESQKEMINNIFEFDDTTAGEVMTHRTEIVAVEKNAKISEIVYLAINEGFSRLPVYDKDLDNIIGLIYVKDLLCLVAVSYTHLKAVPGSHGIHHFFHWKPIHSSAFPAGKAEL